MPHSRLAIRWSLLAALLGMVWLLTPHPVPLYDGIGFPDEPYRYAPARPGAPAATGAQVRLAVAGGSNTVGLIANSAEVGPQVSVYAPPHAFAAAGTAPVVVAARPVPLVAPAPLGRTDSAVYAVSFTSAAGPVTLVPAAQKPMITMRSVSSAPDEPVLVFRTRAGSTWQELPTRRVGRDLSTATLTGAGEYVLVLRAASTAKSGHGALPIVLAATGLLMLAVLVALRVVARRARPS